MNYAAKIIADSISPSGHRITTIECTFPRFILAEYNTHRVFCLAGDSMLEFDSPAGSRKGEHRRVYRMTIAEFVDKWSNGADRVGANPKTNYDTSWINPDERYTAQEAASRFGMANPSNINKLCRDGYIKAERFSTNGRTWIIFGRDLIVWRSSKPEHTRFDMRAKLAGMAIRQLNEDTGDIQTSHVVTAHPSGTKEVFEVRAGDFRIAGSRDHRVLTAEGWRRIEDLQKGDLLVVRKFGKKDDDRTDPLRLKKIDGKWRSVWQRQMRDRMRSMDAMCRRCCAEKGNQIHHVVPVHQDPSLALEETNVTLLCDDCHCAMHEKQGWQGGTYLYGSLARIDEIVSRGQEPTYDLEIVGKYPNFLANGVVVHNSRNSASSRAIPVEKNIERVKANPFVPIAFTKNQKGMQATEVMSELSNHEASKHWTDALDACVRAAQGLFNLAVHKQHANRLLEPWGWQTVICTATEWDNFFALRCDPNAQPEMQMVAGMMKDVYDKSEPKQLKHGEWHLPYVDGGDASYYSWSDTTTEVRLELVKVSAARCARVSALAHDGKRDISKDLELYDRLVKPGHMSPLEHPCRPMTEKELEMFYQPVYEWDELNKAWIDVDRCTHFLGNVQGWVQHRKTIPGEHNFALIKESLWRMKTASRGFSERWMMRKPS